MSEIRRDPLTNAWIIVAPVRSTRPEELVEMQLPLNYVVPCPFCGGNEDSTPQPSLVLRDTDQHRDGWSVRVVPNKYPAVEFDCQATTEPSGHHPLFESHPLAGAHEVIIESPLHVQSLSELGAQQVFSVFKAYAERLKHWFRQPHVRYAVVFKNVGAAAGASLRHLHSQLLATSLIPPQVASSYERMSDYYLTQHRCLLCDMIAEELQFAKRLVAQTEDFIAYCPFASYLPYLVRVVSRQHQTAFQNQCSDSLAELSLFVRRLIGLLESAYSPVAYNFVIHTRDVSTSDRAGFHWWIDLFPRITKVAGFEWGSGGMINPVAPEKAAAHLRSLDRLRTVAAPAEDFSV